MRKGVIKGNKLITLFRYNLFLLNYPIGVFCELTYIHNVFINTQTPELKLVYITIMSIYFPFFPMLYNTLLKNRKRALINLKKKQE